MACPDDLSLGPLAATAERRAWFERGIGPGHGGFEAPGPAVWSAAPDPDRPRTVWWSCRAVESVGRLADGPCRAIDLSDAPLRRMGEDGEPRPAGTARTLALLSPERIVRSGLLDRAESLAAESRAALRARWSRLREEDAPLRVPTCGGGIASAPIPFDDAVLRNTPDEWRPVTHAVAEVLTDSRDTHLHQTSRILLAARVHAPAAAGRIGLRAGDPRRGMAGAEIRPARRTATP